MEQTKNIIDKIDTIQSDNEVPIILSNYEPTTDEASRLNINSNNLYNDISSLEPYTIIQEEYLDLIKENHLNVFGADIIFSSKKWDFSNLKNDFNKYKQHSFNFNVKGEPLTDFYETFLKLFVLNAILEDGSLRRYLINDFYFIKVFFVYLQSKNVYLLENCTELTVNDFLTLQRAITAETTIVKYQTAILKMFNFYSILTNKEINQNVINVLTKRNKNSLKITQKNGLIKLLPNSFMKNLTKLLYDDIINTDFNSLNNIELKNYRKEILIFILTQTGIRPEEVLTIPYDCIIKDDLNNIDVYFMRYNITKSIYGPSVEETQTVANEKVVKIISKLRDNYKGTYLGDKISYRQLRDFFYQYCEDNCSKLENISDLPIDSFMAKPLRKEINGKGKYINIPRLKQFRVYFDSELKRRGFNDFSRAKLLGHHDEKMFYYYGRDVTILEEDINFSQILIKDFINDSSLKILGPKGNIYTKRIRKFLDKLDKKKIQGAYNIEELSQELMNEMPIRTKLGGCCIKPYSNAECNKNDNTDEYLCSYGLCENQCHFFYNCMYYYDKFHEMIDAYNHNSNAGYEKFASKELYKIQQMLKGKLIPELEELNRMIEINGVETIKNNYPDVVEIIDNYGKIKGEIDLWMNKTVKN